MSKVVFILGSGPRIGTAVAKRFLQEGYKVAIGKRTTDAVLEGVLTVKLDVASNESVAQAFREVEEKLGFPNVVVYNSLYRPALTDDTPRLTSECSRGRHVPAGQQ